MAFNRLVDADLDARNPRTPCAICPPACSLAVSPGATSPFPRRLPVRAGRLKHALPAPGAARPGCRLLLFLHQAIPLPFPTSCSASRSASLPPPPDRRGPASSTRVFSGSPAADHNYMEPPLRRHLRLARLRNSMAEKKSAGERSPSFGSPARSGSPVFPAPADDRLPARSGPLALARLPGAGGVGAVAALLVYEHAWFTRTIFLRVDAAFFT